MRVFSGKELLDLLGRITSNSEIIEINRSQSRNNNAKFSSIQVCSRITNGAIGFAIGHKINQIICVNRFCHDENQFRNTGIYEIIYKNDIFITSLGISWIFETRIGKNLINHLFSDADSSIWNLDLDIPNVFIQFEHPFTIENIAPRLSTRVVFVPPKLEMHKVKINKILLVPGDFKQSELSPAPDAIFSFSFSSSLINYCSSNQIILMFVHADAVYSEIIREIGRVLANELKTKTVYYTNTELKFQVIKNGLSGI